jgi:hypothetical protein
MCDVSAACLRGDSSARSKLLEIVQGEKANPELSALRELWEVARAKKASGDRR